MQRATDCDMVLIHDDDLGRIEGFGHDSVSGLRIVSHSRLILAVNRGSRTRSDDGPPLEVQHNDK